jgi:DNA-binding NtrC family response regulator
MERLTRSELSEIRRNAQWHGNCLGHRQIEPYKVTPLLHLLLDDYEQLRGPEASRLQLRPAMALVERQFIIDALAAHDNNRYHTARDLGISHRSLLYKITEYGLPKQKQRRRKDSQ